MFGFGLKGQIPYFALLNLDPSPPSEYNYCPMFHFQVPIFLCVPQTFLYTYLCLGSAINLKFWFEKEGKSSLKLLNSYSFTKRMSDNFYQVSNNEWQYLVSLKTISVDNLMKDYCNKASETEFIKERRSKIYLRLRAIFNNLL